MFLLLTLLAGFALDGGQCVECLHGELFSDGNCIPCASVDGAVLNFGQCKCPQWLGLKGGQCVRCLSDELFSNGLCIPCEDLTGQMLQMVGFCICLTGNSVPPGSLECVPCATEVVDGYCLPCTTEVVDGRCLPCPTEVVDGRCLPCPTEVVDGRCLPCPPSELFSDGYCIPCKYVDNAMLNNAGQCDCPQGFALDGRHCVRCLKDEQVVDGWCQPCLTVLIGGLCIQCPGVAINGKCCDLTHDSLFDQDWPEDTCYCIRQHAIEMRDGVNDAMADGGIDCSEIFTSEGQHHEGQHHEGQHHEGQHHEGHRKYGFRQMTKLEQGICVDMRRAHARPQCVF